MSPFDFRLLKSIGRPTSSFYVALAVALFLSTIYLRTFTFEVRSVGWGVDRLLDMTECEEAVLPQVLVGGSSMTGLGINMMVLDERLKMPSCKLSLSAGSLSECYLMMRTFQDACKDVNLVIVDFDWGGNEAGNTQEHQRRMLLLENFNETSGTLTRKIEIVRKPFSLFIKSFRAERDGPGPYEKIWYDQKYADAHQQERQELQEKWEKIQYEGYDTNDWSFGLNADHKKIPSETVGEFIDYCEKNKIYVVFILPPKWRGSEWRLCEKYQAYLREINELPHCSVIQCPNFSTIQPTLKDEDCLLDNRHMTEYGATVYTKWLLDQLYSSPHFVKHLERNDIHFLNPIAEW